MSSPTTPATCTRATSSHSGGAPARPTSCAGRPATVVRMSRRITLCHDPGGGDHTAGRMRPGLRCRPTFRHQLRSQTTRCRRPQTAARRTAADRGTQERSVVARLHVETQRRRGGPRRTGIKLDCASFDADLDPVNGGSGSVSIGVVRARSVRLPRTPGRLSSPPALTSPPRPNCRSGCHARAPTC